ncbi:FtsX-like permease family protein [uncultured Amnibacterium sp.]|uniref:FtsX-like permease family protein n=1 Tax=uncultured Amnibacterium sp. TaxID=1631851 RepID=UPI0035CBDA2D
MRLLSLALRGLWWRRATSAALLVVAAITTIAAAAGPLYAAAASDAVLQRALRVAPVGSDGTGIEVIADQTGRPSTQPLREAVVAAFTGAARAAYPSPVMQLSITQRGVIQRTGRPAQIELTDRDGFCGHVRAITGACVSAADRTGFVVDAATARERQLRVGQTITVPDPRSTESPDIRLQLRGIVERRVPTDRYWFGDSGASASGSGDAEALQAWVPTAYFSAMKAESGDGIIATADLALAPGAIHASGVGAFRRSLDAATRRVKTDGPARPSVSSGVDRIVAGGLSGGSRLALPIAVVVAELLVLGWYLLHTLVSSAAEARGAEVALGKLRGLTPRATAVFTLLEPALLLVVAVPVGVLGALLAVRGLAPSVIGADAQIRLGPLPWAAAAAAAAGGLVAAVAGSIAVLRRPVLEQWRRTTRRPARRAAVLEAVVVVLAVAGVVQLRLSGALDGGRSSGIALLAPALLTIAGAIVASRLVAPVARLAFAATRASGAVATFIGVRQLARRPAGRRTFGVLAVAVAMAVFGVSSAAVLAQNRQDRALIDIGAPTVLHVVRDSRTIARVRAVDGGAQRITAVSQAETNVSSITGVFDSAATASASPSVLVVDPASFGSVAYWRGDFGSAPLTRLLHPLTAPTPAMPTVTGTSLALDVAASSVPASLTLAVDLTDARGSPVTARLGTLRAGSRTYSARIAACAAGCQLRRVYVTRPDDVIGVLITSFTVRAVRVSGGTAPSMRPALTAVQWSPLNPTPELQTDPAETIATTPAGLAVTIAVSGQPNDGVPGFGAVAGAVTRQPALVASRLITGDTRDTVTVDSPGGQQFAVDPSGRVQVVPRAGDGGIVLARDWVAAASPSGYLGVAPDQVWLGADAPVDTVGRLRRAGVVVTSIQRADDRAVEFARQGPAFSTALTVAGGVVAVLLAGATAVLSLALLARRRIFELSAMRALGIGTRRLVGSVVVEQAALVVGATITGVLLGAASAALALPALPAYVDAPAYPAFVVDQPVGILILVAAIVVVLLLVAVTATAVLLARAASPSRLREAEG